MSDVKIQVDVPLDEDGLMELQCPFCNELFKLDADELQSEDVIDIFCPNCGLTTDFQGFLTDDVLESIRTKAENIAINLLNEEFKKMEKKSKGFLKVKDKLKLEPERVLYVKGNDFEPITFSCCGRKAKVSISKGATEAYCPYCGNK